MERADRIRRLRVVIGAALVATALSTVPRANATAVTISYRTYLFAEGFDTCEHVDSATLDAWWSGTPWYFYGTYLGGAGGSQVGCVPMSVATIQHAATIGMGLEMFWYGRQMPSSCTGLSFTSTISLNTTTAYNQGVTEANNAAAAAATYSYGLGPVIYFDLEEVGTSSTCIAAAQAFINGWDHQLNSGTDYWGGLYGSSCSSQLSHFASISNPPFNIAPRDTSHSPTGVYGLSCLSDTLWNNDQRIHQLAAEIKKSYGGVSMFIDEDCADGRLASNRSSGFDLHNCAKY